MIIDLNLNVNSIFDFRISAFNLSGIFYNKVLSSFFDIPIAIYHAVYGRLLLFLPLFEAGYGKLNFILG